MSIWLLNVYLAFSAVSEGFCLGVGLFLATGVELEKF